ncbi:hypothetical protein B0J13DRAFT_450979 [Dactylonectria estremocensis]|uniref:F-box domain-containing protein n=1 Tax=Dactylonectria estremocensis TaxID=1079267 RepID=A0A9P9ITU0_9HYPO|nr:hypothetical protein B0J13DRAFT_450979 [Dactylonectria estremocensis]
MPVPVPALNPAVTFLGDPFELVPVIREILRTRYCVPGSIFLVEGLDRVSVSSSGRWQAIRLLLGDGVLCIQALLPENLHRFIQTGDISVGSYIQCESFQFRLKESGPLVYLVLEDLVAVGWNASYRATQPDPQPDPTDQIDQPANQTDAPSNQLSDQTPRSLDASQDSDAAEEAFEAFDVLAYPKKPKTQPVALARDWHDPQMPLKLTTLRSIPHLPYAQNWSCNVLAIVASLSPVEASNLAPHRQRTARLTDPSTSKQVHLTVFLDPEDFIPDVGSAVLLLGVKNHRFDGGSLKKYASDRGRWWFQDPTHLTWCDGCACFQLAPNTADMAPVDSGIQPERKAELHQFVSSLSPWELLHVRNLLQDRRIKLAGLQDLPPEIVCDLIPHLDLEDAIACRLVSKGWTIAWSHGAVWTCLCKRFAPGVLETFPTETSRHLFFDAMRRKKQRQIARFFDKNMILWDMTWDSQMFRNVVRPRSTISHGPDIVTGDFNVFYANGKMTWQPSRDLVIVDDLQEGTRHRFAGSPLNQTQSQLLAASNKLIVRQHSQGRNVVRCITHMESGETKPLHLSGTVSHCYAQNESIGVVTTAGEITIWGEGNARELDLSRVETLGRSPGVPALLFHPTQSNIVFAVWLYEHVQPDPRLYTFVVAKFQDACPVWQSKTSIANPLTNADDACASNTSWVKMDFNAQKSDNFGSYSLGIYRLQGKFHGPAELCKCHTWRPGDWGAITFNVLGQTFSQHYYEGPRKRLVWDTNGEYGNRIQHTMESFLKGVHLWNQDLLLVWNSDYEAGMQILHPIGSILSRRFPMQTTGPVDLNFDSEFPTGPLFQSDDYIFVPTTAGMWMLKLAEIQITNEKPKRERHRAMPVSRSNQYPTNCVNLVRLTHGVARDCEIGGRNE